ncbi:predicted protein [Naegleria gruberi]|uniref:Predicted protein n=1 Tax=Naegleria gruberi TaxID=5762 RepID=D2W412_NAEGR|nr:uncharacterized protein NAEGRDRAFT_76142 [Naegleria gruberi]EFC36165.1 predicted protein [Naegleria gruberi]|eukprot:XP_002668909.1 predicted protein [Naegleria gruberi strain NEG-M]
MFQKHSLKSFSNLTTKKNSKSVATILCGTNSVPTASEGSFQMKLHSKRQSSLPYFCKYYNTNHTNTASPAVALSTTHGAASNAFHHVDSFTSYNTHQHKQQHQQHDQNVADYHQAMNILRELNQIRHQNYVLNKQISHLQEYVHVKESNTNNSANLSSWMDTNPFKFGLLCGSVVFVLIALRMDLEKNRKKVKELKEELSKLSIKRRYGNY